MKILCFGTLVFATLVCFSTHVSMSFLKIMVKHIHLSRCVQIPLFWSIDVAEFLDNFLFWLSHASQMR